MPVVSPLGTSMSVPSNGVKIYPAKHTSNGVTVHTVADVEIAEISDDPEISNGVTVHTPLKNNLQEDKIKKESQKGHRPGPRCQVPTLPS